MTSTLFVTPAQWSFCQSALLNADKISVGIIIVCSGKSHVAYKMLLRELISKVIQTVFVKRESDGAITNVCGMESDPASIHPIAIIASGDTIADALRYNQMPATDVIGVFITKEAKKGHVYKELRKNWGLTGEDIQSIQARIEN